MSQKRTRADIIDMHKARVEECFEDYRLAVLNYAEWLADFHKRMDEKEGGLDADRISA